MHALSRRIVLGSLCSLALMPSTSAGAQDQPLKIIVPYAAGGSADAVARMLADQLQTSLGRSVVVDNRAGAGGRIGTRAVKDSPPDGTALLLAANTLICIHPHVYANLGYDPLVDLLPITQVMTFDLALVVSGKLPVRSLQELVAWVKANPDQGTYGSPGAGTAAHFTGAEFGRLAKLDLRHVAYRGTPVALPDLISGRLPMYLASLAEFLEHHKAGGIRVLATADAVRSTKLPDVPTLQESGFDIQAPGWFAIYAPAGTPAGVAERLRGALIDALQKPDMQARIEALGFQVTGTSGEALAQIQRANHDRWGAIVRVSGFKPE
jgi:tripartite-type tricarboxylate transporter receptor subunit TctC